jgi:hypothetical protein
MLRSLAPALLAGCLAALPATPARGVLCALDPMPAATLLLPYFDLDARDLAKPKPKRESTVLSIVNLGPAATIARVTLWTDLGVPTLAFDLYLTGFDVQEVDLWRVFQGTLPGDLAIRCDDGAQTTRELPPERVEALRLAHAGKPDPTGGLCSGVDYADTLLRGYVTIDNSNGCVANSAVYPSDPGYFGVGGIASSENVLGGQYLVQSRKGKTSESGRLVALEADAGVFSAGDQTFYGRYVQSTGADEREPLPATWAVRYLNDALAKQATELVVWRSSEAVQTPFLCTELGVSGWYPLALGDHVAFDDEENAAEADAAAFPAEASRVALGGSELPIAFSRGWLFLAVGAGGELGQAHVTARVRQGALSARGLVEASALDAPCGDAPPPAVPIPATP